MGRLAFWVLVVIAGMALAGGGLTWGLTVRAEADFPPLGRSVTANGARVHAVAKGEGPAILLLHGAYGTLHDFTNTIADELARGHRIIAPDRPGHGYSARPAGPMTPDAQARLIHAALAELGERRAIVVGFSYGAAVALAYALAFPDDTAALVVLNGPSHVWLTPTSRLYDIAAIPVLGTLMTHTIVTPLGHLLLDSGARAVFAPEPVPPGFARAALPLTIRPGSYAANADDLRNLKPFLAEQSKRYGELRMPVEIVAGTMDRSVSPEIHARILVREVAGAVLTEIPGAGHPLLYAHPDAALAAIRRAVARANRPA